MKLPRNARIFRGQLDAAPFAGVFFLLVLFLLLSALVYTPQGVPLHLPRVDEMPAPNKPTLSVAVDANGRLYYQNTNLDERELTNTLAAAVRNSAQPLTLILEVDQAVPTGTDIHLWSLARAAGISEVVLATLPRPFTDPQRGVLP